MNSYEFDIHLNGTNIKIFTQPAFFNHSTVTTTLHKHRYAEVHLIESGSLKYLIGNRNITVNAEELLVIPENTFHKCYPADAAASFIAFQLNWSFSEPVKHSSIPGIFSKLTTEITRSESTGMWGKIPAYLTLICSDILCDNKRKLTPIQDRQFIIHEFFSTNYANNVTLGDLAAELNLSLKQTERLIKEYTGNTFREEMARKRIQAARHLISNGDITLAEVSEQVGYHTYSGFWKAFHQG